jgi:hypothetical protein
MPVVCYSDGLQESRVEQHREENLQNLLYREDLEFQAIDDQESLAV